MDTVWPFVVLLVYPALQVPMAWAVVRYFGLRNDDGPASPTTYSTHPAATEGDGRPGRCRRCGTENDATYDVCRSCLARLPVESPRPAG